ncbi:AMP-dependent synthetase and ligase [Oscillochloris trichoides DG-6]|uniref:AMP-dependent synthetase and ligase n=1 Tax=Oscillochloris trichoides DG-6 TaxID=765420 RepID=E1IHE7_9CHLR|nr:class I adenylate-forming enzyme family protein [Oscillochloris trichoides]EFO79400.1 AMP-dependent synthetase and ligase [Oscillochloris trichoides DG-6]
MNTTDYLLEHAQDQCIALIDGDRTYTYGQLHTLIHSMVYVLHVHGVGLQDRVGIFGANSWFWVVAYLATLKLGAVAVPFSPAVRPPQLRVMQQRVKCRVVCGLEAHLTPPVRAVFADLAVITPTQLESACLEAPAPPANVACPPDMLAALMLTSGTTAQARAVCVTHGNIQANTDSIIESLDIAADDRMMVVLPFHYCFGTSLLHTHLRMGASLVLASNTILIEVVLNEIEAYQCTSLAGVPSIYQMLLRNSTFPRRSMPSLRTFQQAGGKLQSVLIAELAALRPQARIFVMYGQTEATARLACLPAELLHTKPGSIGRGLPGVELRVINADGVDVQPGEVGQIVARGGNITLGYLDEPEATALSFVDGALYTGDMATVDADGFIYIVDRQKDFIKSLGHRVSSYEIEACVMTVPQVVAAAAVGVPDPLLGEAIRLFVTLQPGTQLATETILDQCRRNLPRYMVPREVRVLDQMPMNQQGKILKTALREME